MLLRLILVLLLESFGFNNNGRGNDCGKVRLAKVEEPQKRGRPLVNENNLKIILVVLCMLVFVLLILIFAQTVTIESGVMRNTLNNI